MATLLKRPQADNRSARSGDSSKSGLLRVAAMVSSALSILWSLARDDLITSLMLGLIGFALATWDMRIDRGKSAGRQVLAFSVLALTLDLLYVALFRQFARYFFILASIPLVGAWVALYLAGYLHTRKPKAVGEQAERSVAVKAIQQNSRVSLATGVLLTGLSIAIPAVMIAFVYPLNGSQYVCCERRGPYGQPWVGETWWPLVFAAIALSMGCAIRGLMLAARSRVSAGEVTEAQSAKAPHWVTRSASSLLGFALLILMLAPIVTLYLRSPIPDGYDASQPIKRWINPELLNNGWGAAFISLGLICIALAVWGAWTSNPQVARRWTRPLTAIAFVLAMAGNAITLLVFMLIGFWL